MTVDCLQGHLKHSEGKAHSNEGTGCPANDSARTQSGVFIKNSLSH